MGHEQRLAACAALGLFLAMFLPWYQRQFFLVVGGKLQPGSDSQTAWAQFSFVEAAVLLVAAGVLTLLFQRAEGKAFHLPGGDGWVITVAGLWTCALIVWRIFDKQGGSAHGQNATTYGIEWGIFVALAVAASLAYAGSRIRASHRPEPPLPGDDGPGGVPLPGDEGAGGVPLPGDEGPGGVPLPGDDGPGGVPLPGDEGPGDVPLPGDDGPGGVPAPEPEDAGATAPTIPLAAPTIRRAEPPLASDPEPRRERGWLTAPRRDPDVRPLDRQPPRPRHPGG